MRWRKFRRSKRAYTVGSQIEVNPCNGSHVIQCSWASNRLTNHYCCSYLLQIHCCPRGLGAQTVRDSSASEVIIGNRSRLLVGLPSTNHSIQGRVVQRIPSYESSLLRFCPTAVIWIQPFGLSLGHAERVLPTIKSLDTSRKDK